MAKTDTSERWFEARVVRGLTGVPQPEYSHALAPTDFAATHNGYVQGKPTDYNRDVALDVAQLLAFLQATQPKAVDTLELAADGIKRTQFLHRLQGEITKRGVVDVLRKGVSHGPVHVDLYKLLPTPGNATAAEAFAKNIFSVTRQVRYSNDSGNELDLVIFINGLPVLTFELKNSLTKQTLADAIVQYQTTREPRELLFQLGRCVAHFAVDDNEAAFCTELKGKASWFLPFNQGWNSGAGTFVLDFADNAEAVKAAFQDYYRATIQTGETDANKLHDLKAELDAQQVYSWQQVEDLVALYLSGADRDKLDPILDACVAEYTDQLGEDDQVKFKGKAKAFVRSYGFLAAILSYGHPAWEKLSIFLNFLIPKLPAPKEEDLSKGVLETIDMDSYRVEAKAALKMAMDDADATVEPVPPRGGGFKLEPEIDKLSNIVREFNDLFGNIEWKDEDKIRKVITEEIPARVAQDKAYQNAQANSDKQNARLEHDKALNRVVLELLSDHTELFKQFSDNPNFKRWLTDMVFDATYQPGTVPPKAPPQMGAGV